MAVRLSSLVWDSGPTSRHQRFILLAIADCADDAGFAWPSISHLSAKTLFSVRAVIDAIQGLEADGWVTVSKKAEKGKGNHYRLNIAKLSALSGAKSSHAEIALDETQVQFTTDSGAIYDNPPHPLIGRTVIEPSYTLTPREKPAKTPKPTKVTVPAATVEKLYRAYPRHVAPGDARQAIPEAIARIAKADGISQSDAAEKLLQRVERYAVQVKKAGTEMQYVPYPATWFNKERYDDDSLQGESPSAVQYTDPALIYESPEYRHAGARRSA